MAGQGRSACIGFAAESTWGTAVSRTNWRPVISSNLLRVPSVIPRTDLHAGGPTRRSKFIEREVAGGSVSVLATYDNIGLLLKTAMGASSTSGTNPYTHVYTLDNDLPSLTIENIRGTSTNSEVFEGAKIQSLGLSCSAGTEMTMDLDFLAETGSARASAGTPSFAATEDVIRHHHAGQFTFNSVSYDLSSFSLSMTTGIDRRDLLGSKLTKEPLRTGYAEITLNVTLEQQDALYVALLAGTESDTSITFTSGVKSFQVEVENAYIETASDPISDAGIIMQDVTIRGLSDGTNHGLKLTMINGNTAATAN